MKNTTGNSGGQQKHEDVSLDDESLGRLAAQIVGMQKPRRTKSQWRSLIAVILVIGFLGIIGFIVVTDQIWGSHTPATDLLSTVGTLITSPLSFVIGYYYKDKNG